MKTNSQRQRNTKILKVALVHDYLREYGGAERVLEALHKQFPTAPVYVAFVDKESMGIQWKRYKKWDIRETWMARIPFIKKLFSPLRFLAPRAFADLDLSAYDLVISSSNAYYAKAVTVPNGIHICYCHTPPRSLYGYQTMMDWKKNPLIRVFGELINHYLRIVDFRIAQKVDLFIANSKETRRRIQKFYRRESTVIYPPITRQLGNLKTKGIGSNPQVTQSPSNLKKYWLFLSRLAYAKNPQLAVEWATRTNNILVVAGEGKMRAQLEKIAGPTVIFLGFVSDEELPQLYAQAKGLIYPVIDEDFGMVPVEAMSYGVPIIAHNSGGPKETVLEGKTGVLFDELTVEGLTQAIEKAEKISWNKEKIKKHAAAYDADNFKTQIEKVIATKNKNN